MSAPHERMVNRYPAELSGGEMQRFCIARALAPQTVHFIADEIKPYGSTQAQVWELSLKVLKERGIGLIPHTASELAARIWRP